MHDGCMPRAREVLNRLKWTQGVGLNDVVVKYVHRGAPGDELSINGTQIIELGSSFMELAGAQIPYHRITTITYNEEVLYEKRSW